MKKKLFFLVVIIFLGTDLFSQVANNEFTQWEKVKDSISGRHVYCRVKLLSEDNVFSAIEIKYPDELNELIKKEGQNYSVQAAGNSGEIDKMTGRLTIIGHHISEVYTNNREPDKLFEKKQSEKNDTITTFFVLSKNNPLYTDAGKMLIMTPKEKFEIIKMLVKITDRKKIDEGISKLDKSSNNTDNKSKADTTKKTKFTKLQPSAAGSRN